MAQYLTYPVLGSSNANGVGTTTEQLILYVTSTGSDNLGDGSQLNPYLTIQKAIDQLPKFINHTVEINVGVGNFAGFVIQGFIIAPSVPLGGSLKVKGTAVTATLTSGLTTGTIASATAGTASTATWGTATVTGAGWTVNNLIGKWIRIDSGTGAGQYKLIAFNDATTITITGNWTTAPTGATFTILDNGTIIDAAHPGGSSSGIVIYANSSGGSGLGAGTSISLDTIGNSFTRGIFWDSPGAGLYIVRCSFTCNNLGINTVDGSSLNVDDSYFTGQVSTVFTSLPFSGRALMARRNVFNISTRGVSLTGPPGQNAAQQTAFLTNNYYRGMSATTGIAVIGGPNSTVIALGERIDAITASSRVGYGLINSTNSTSHFSITACDISNCSKAIDILEGGYINLLGVVSGTGNTIGISATTGAAVKISSTTTLTGTTEISIDGIAQTLATMRAQVPKVLEDSNYGTKVYE